jgi:hypothetical protein
MKMSDLMEQILQILPNAVFGEEQATGEIVIASGLVENPAGELVDIDE